jgi:hypothetical protein
MILRASAFFIKNGFRMGFVIEGYFAEGSESIEIQSINRLVPQLNNSCPTHFKPWEEAVFLIIGAETVLARR